MATVEELIEKAQMLQPDEQKRLRDALAREAKLAQIREVQAEFANSNVSSEDLIRRKAEEIELEDRRFKRRET